MTKRLKKTVTLVWVRWFDASYQRGECTDSELVTKVELESAGLLVREDEESVSIAMDSYVNDRTWRHIEHIPKVNILRIKRLTV